MKKTWWPTRVYEARPWIAIAAGTLLATSAAHGHARGEWTFLGALVFLSGCGLVVYGAVVLQIRRDYRKRSKWYRENS